MFVNLVVRLNDRLGVYPYQAECNADDSVRAPLNPALSLYMKKRSSLNGAASNGTYPNPVAVLGSENITYTISGVNANTSSGQVIVRDTLPTYLNFVSSISSNPTSALTTTTVGSLTALEWNFGSLGSFAPFAVTFNATPAAGSVASQPLFVNWAFVNTSDTLNIHTDSATYHQGAGIAVVTFSATAGGIIFGEPQAVDYSTSVTASSLLVVPDSGYVFAGWSHPAYMSLRDVEIPAVSGIMNLDTLQIYGDVELTAEFINENLIQNGVLTHQIADPREYLSARIWSSGGELLVNIDAAPSILRIYTPEGVLIKQQTILNKGITKIKMQRGIYIANLNNSVGVKVLIE